MIATVPVLCLGMVTLWRTGRFREMLALIVAPLVGFGLMFFFYASYTIYWWFLQPWFLLVAMVVTADFWWNRRSRPLATVAVGWLAIWLTVASAWPAKNYLVRVTLAPEQRLTPNVQKLRELIPTGARVLTSIGWWALGNDRSVYDPNILRHSGPRSHRVFRNGQQWHRPTRRLVPAGKPAVRCDGAREL